jgi:acetyltransferase-like isoleucine patch superfamily enzyme
MPHERVEVFPSPGPHNSLWYVYRQVNFFRATWNVMWITLARYAPFYRLKNGMLRLTGAKIGKHVALGFEMTLDILYPQKVTIEDDAIVGYDTVILCHGYLRDEYQVGPVTIGKGASVGARCTILPGVTIGEGAVIGAMSLVNRDVPAGEFWAGVPARRIREHAVDPHGVDREQAVVE